MAREAAERVVLTLTRENVCANIVSTPSLEIFDDRQPNGTDGFTLLTVFQPQGKFSFHIWHERVRRRPYGGLVESGCGATLYLDGGDWRRSNLQRRPLLG